MSEAVKDVIYRQALAGAVEKVREGKRMETTSGHRVVTHVGKTTIGLDGFGSRYAVMRCWYCGCWDSKGYVTCPRCNGPRKEG